MPKKQDVYDAFESDMVTLVSKLQDNEYANNLYRALCNMRWGNKNFIDPYSCTWRYAGGLVAKLRNKGENYMKFYCNGYEGNVAEEISRDLHKLGWKECPWPGRL